MGSGASTVSLRCDFPRPCRVTRFTTGKRIRRHTTASRRPEHSPQDTQSIEGRGLEAVFDFAPSSEPLVVKVALSPVSEENAIANMDAEMPDFEFDGYAPATQQMWRAGTVGRVEFHASPAMEKSLYTALYHAMMAPSTSMDVNGEYRGPDNQVHRAEGFRFVSSLSLWDTYRAEQPLMTLLEPEQRTNDLVQVADRLATGEPIRHSAGVAVCRDWRPGA